MRTGCDRQKCRIDSKDGATHNFMTDSKDCCRQIRKARVKIRRRQSWDTDRKDDDKRPYPHPLHLLGTV